MTADRSQGSTHQNVVAVLSSKHGEGANQARAYVQASRTAETLTFVTNDTRLLGMRLNDQVSERVGRSPRQIYRMVAAGEFPKQRRQSHKVSVWYEREIKEWQVDRMVEDLLR